MSRVSVIVCNNASRHLTACLDGVRAQRYVEFEAVLVDYRMDPPAGDVPGFRVVRWEDPEPGWNHAKARNCGIAHARTDTVCFVNSDCVMHPDLLRWALGAHDGRNQVYHTRFQAEKGQAADWSGNMRGVMGPKSAYGDFLLTGKTAIVEFGGFDERCAGWGNYDVDLAVRLERNGHPILWGEGLRLIHLWHPPQAGQGATWRRNVDACSPDWLAGRDVRNRGPATFRRYLRG